MNAPFKLKSPFKPAGDQPKAIKSLLNGLKQNKRHQILLGVTGSGKTFTVASVIAQLNKAVLVVSHNKVLAAQLYAEFKSFFPENAVEYFISYYDYYQPEAYIAQTDTYIEKDASINEHIERLRLKATASLLMRRDTIVVASVSCIYNIGDPQDFKDLCIYLERGRTFARELLTHELVLNQYERNDVEFAPGRFRGRGQTLEVFPSYLENPIRITFSGDEIAKIEETNKITGEIVKRLKSVFIYPTRHFVTPRPRLEEAVRNIEAEMCERVAYFKSQNKLLEAQRLETRTKYDLAMLRSVGFCHGIENYSRHLSGRMAGHRPACLIDYFPKDFLLIVDESHATIPQLKGMYEGDRSRKQTLVDFGFRLPSALDNRPLKFAEIEALANQVVYISATPGPYEISKPGREVVEQVVRPTGLVDPEVQIHPIKNQIEHLIHEITATVKDKGRVLVTMLTKRTAEDLSEYLARRGSAVRYLHSDIEPLERIKILKDLRLGHFHVLIGVNLLREGLDIPEVSLVAILDADKEGFLRSETSLIQTCGRAARNIKGRVVLYADSLTGSMERALAEMTRRRNLQLAYNIKHAITPKSIVREVQQLTEFEIQAKQRGLLFVYREIEKVQENKSVARVLGELEAEMKEAAERLDFESAAFFRDQIFELRSMLAGKAGLKSKAASS